MDNTLSIVISILMLFGLEGVAVSSKQHLLMCLAGVVLVAVIVRKLSGVFTFISVLDAQFNAHELVHRYIDDWTGPEAD